jgi:intracellular septation protein A
MSFTLWRYPKRRFQVGGEAFAVSIKSRSDGLVSVLWRGRDQVAVDATPLLGPESVRNHRLETILADGRPLAVEAGYISLWNTGIVATAGGALVHESHPGKTVAYPENYRDKMAQSSSMSELMAAEGGADGTDFGVWKRNRVAIIVDIVMGLIFFVAAKLTDLPTAALVAAGLGIALVVVQRFVTVDLIGGMALFGVAMALVSAGLALAFQDDLAVKMRGVILGTIGAILFLGDGLLLKGRRLGAGMARYIPYSDIDPRRLAIGMGLLGLVMALINLAAAQWLSTDLWLYYTTFGDILLFAILVQFVFKYARDPALSAPKAVPAG